MQEPEIDTFAEVRNSLYDAMFDRTHRTDIRLPPQALISNLSTVSALYFYTNPPPMAYGTQAPYVAETVDRTRKFNLKKTNKTIQIDKYTIDHPVWEDDFEGFPFKEIHSNWHPYFVHKMCKKYLVDNFMAISRTAKSVMEDSFGTNSDELTKGKQTWDPLTGKSVPSARAYITFSQWILKNCSKKKHTMVEMIQFFMTIMNKSSIKSSIPAFITLESKRRRNRVLLYNFKKKKVTRKITVNKNKKGHKDGEPSQEYVMHHCLDIARSFCSYVKQGERAHLKRRAIASPSIIMRAFLYIVEDFHLKLHKIVEGGTISIGGEEKKLKIAHLMTSNAAEFAPHATIQVTADATKWNECMSASLFGMITQTFFDDAVRVELGLPKCTQEELLFAKISMSCHFLLSIKRITLGEGPSGVSDERHGLIDLKPENLPRLNKFTQDWYSRVLDLQDEMYLNSSGGMLMGIHNAMSTTAGMISVGFLYSGNCLIKVLRSSDDWMSYLWAASADELHTGMRQEILNLSLCAINMSPKKTFYFSGYYGEYTSWYQDGKIVSQYGPETATLRPGGNNPPDDFYNVAKVTAVSLMKTEINPIGAEAKLRLGISNVRALYHIKKRKQEQAPMLIRNEIRVLADGGLNPWNCSNCHLEETSLKKGWAQSPAEYNYLLKIRNPDNPFVNDPKENVTWSKELSTLTIDQMTNPKTVFSLTKRANRAIKNVTGETHAKEEKAYSEALQIMNTADISLMLTTPKDSLPMAQHLRSCIAALVPGVTLSDDEERQVKKALRRLKTKELEEQGNEDDDNQVVDYI